MQRRLALLLFSLAACGDEPAPDDGDDIVAPDATVIDAAPPLPHACIAPITDRQWGGDLDDTAGVTISRSGGLFLYGFMGGSLNDHDVPGARGFLERWNGSQIKSAWSPPEGNRRGTTIDAINVDEYDNLAFVGRALIGANEDLLLGDLSPYGMQLQVETAGLAPSEQPFSLLVDGTRRTVAGYHDVYVPGGAVEAWQDPFVFRYDSAVGAAAGELVTASTERPDIVTGAALAPDGSPVVAGSTESVTGSFVSRVGDRFGGPSFSVPGQLEYVRSIHALADGDYLIAGTTTKKLGSDWFGGQDVFVARLSPDLVARWIQTYGSSGSDFAIDLAVDRATGRSWLLGETTGDVAAPAAGEHDAFVIAVDTDGRARWSVQRGSAGDERPSRIAVDACENVIIAGATNGNLIRHQPRRYDAFVMNVTPEAITAKLPSPPSSALTPRPED